MKMRELRLVRVKMRELRLVRVKMRELRLVHVKMRELRLVHVKMRELRLAQKENLHQIPLSAEIPLQAVQQHQWDEPMPAVPNRIFRNRLQYARLLFQFAVHVG